MLCQLYGRLATIHAMAVVALVAVAGTTGCATSLLAPLHSAVYHGSAEEVRALLEEDPLLAALDPDVRTGSSQVLKKDGRRFRLYDGTPLHVAAATRQPAMLDLLLTYTYGVEVEDGLGRTPLYVAAQSGDAASVRRLLSKGANPNVLAIDNEDGLAAFVHEYETTALSAAIRRGHVDVAELLLEAGAHRHPFPGRPSLHCLKMGEGPYRRRREPAYCESDRVAVRDAGLRRPVYSASSPLLVATANDQRVLALRLLGARPSDEEPGTAWAWLTDRLRASKENDLRYGAQDLNRAVVGPLAAADFHLGVARRLERQGATGDAVRYYRSAEKGFADAVEQIDLKPAQDARARLVTAVVITAANTAVRVGAQHQANQMALATGGSGAAIYYQIDPGLVEVIDPALTKTVSDLAAGFSVLAGRLAACLERMADEDESCDDLRSKMPDSFQ